MSLQPEVKTQNEPDTESVELEKELRIMLEIDNGEPEETQIKK